MQIALVMQHVLQTESVVATLRSGNNLEGLNNALLWYPRCAGPNSLQAVKDTQKIALLGTRYSWSIAVAHLDQAVTHAQQQLQQGDTPLS